MKSGLVSLLVIFTLLSIGSPALRSAVTVSVEIERAVESTEPVRQSMDLVVCRISGQALIPVAGVTTSLYSGTSKLSLPPGSYVVMPKLEPGRIGEQTLLAAQFVGQGFTVVEGQDTTVMLRFK